MRVLVKIEYFGGIFMRVLVKTEDKSTMIFECDYMEYSNDLYGDENAAHNKYGCRFLGSNNAILALLEGVNKKTTNAIQRELLEKGYVDLTAYGECTLMPSPFVMDDLFGDFCFGDEDDEYEEEDHQEYDQASYEEVMQLINDPRYKGYFD